MSQPQMFPVSVGGSLDRTIISDAMLWVGGDERVLEGTALGVMGSGILCRIVLPLLLLVLEVPAIEPFGNRCIRRVAR